VGKHSLVLVAYGSELQLPELAKQALAVQGCSQRVVVLNPSHIMETGHRMIAGVQVIVLEKNLGYSAALNRALIVIEGLQEDTVLVITADVVPPNEVIDELRYQLDDLSIGAVSPVICFENAGRSKSYGGYVLPNGQIGHFTRSETDVSWVDGSCVLFRTLALKAALPLPEDLFLYCEDVVLGLRLRDKGWSIRVIEHLTISQSTGRRTRPLMFGYLETRNRLLLHRHASSLSRSSLIRAEAPRLAFAFVVALVPGHHESWARRLQLLTGKIVGCWAGIRGQSGAPPIWILKKCGVLNT
jgi:GT2 family glycosyltransferase